MLRGAVGRLVRASAPVGLVVKRAQRSQLSIVTMTRMEHLQKGSRPRRRPY